MKLPDTFETRIYLMFIHFSILMIITKKKGSKFDQTEYDKFLNKIEYRRGSAGGGNQLRQPYLSHIASKYDLKKLPNTDHIHFYGLYLGNYPSLSSESIIYLTNIINSS